MSVVLVVEDDVEIRATLRMALEDDSHTVLEARNGMDALAELRSHQSPMVVLLDLLLPLLSGEDILKSAAADAELANRHAFILLTAADQSFKPTFTAVLKQLQVPVVRKPFDLDNLFDVIAQAARRVGA
jgi:two-component system, chemotaxis family, chemotaxis protein CheY